MIQVTWSSILKYDLVDSPHVPLFHFPALTLARRPGFLSQKATYLANEFNPHERKSLGGQVRDRVSGSRIRQESTCRKGKGKETWTPERRTRGVKVKGENGK